MTNTKPRLRRRRPFLFFVLVLALSLPLYALNLLNIPTPLGLPPSFVMIFAPMIVAGVLSMQEGGWSGVRALGQNLIPTGSSTRKWVMLSLTIIPALMVAMYLLVSATGQAQPDGASLSMAAVLSAFVLYALGAVPEEIGWTAYATAPLQRRFGILRAGIIIGVVWELWHVIPFVMQGHSATWIVTHSLASIGIRIIMGYVYAGTKGALVPALSIHALYNFVPMLLPGGYNNYRPEYFLPIVVVAVIWISWLGRKDTSK